MEKEFSIEGWLTVSSDLTEDRFWYAFIGFVEDNNWFFGGGMKEAVGQDGARKIYIQGAVEVSLDLTKDKFWNIFIGFIEGNNWLFDGKIREIIDGHYINEDGTKGRHAFDD